MREFEDEDTDNTDIIHGPHKCYELRIVKHT